MFSFNLSQASAEAYGFGDTWINRHGTTLSASGTVSGFTTYGTASNDPGAPVTGTPNVSIALARVGVELTMTWKTSCTMTVAHAIFTNIDLSDGFLGTPTSSYSWAADGACVESWLTS